MNIKYILSLFYIFLATFIIIFSTFTYTTSAAAENYTFVNKWGSQGDSDGEFEEPTGIAIDSLNDVYVSDMDFENCCNPLHHTVQKFSHNGTFITKWGGNGAFVNPMGIAIDSFGNVYVADQVHQRIAKFTSNGIFITDWASQINPTDIAIDSSDNVYVTEMFDSRIAKFASDGTLITKWNTGPISRGIAVDSSDNIWVTSANNGDTNYLVQKFTSGGILLDQWTSAGTDGVNIPTFNGYGIAFDSSGKLFIADTFNNRIQKYETNGTLITQFGILGTGDGELNWPHDLAINSQDNIFISDTFNHRIQVFAKLIITINNPPVALDKILQTNINTPVTVTLEASDSDMGDFITSFNIISGPIYGQISNFNSETGTLTYTPNNNFVGQDSFTFNATDSQGVESTNTGKITIIVKQSNSPCKCHHGGSFN